MVTYPSTHGVFEEAIGEICAAVHDAGGQVYVDGANLNALVGLAQPGQVRRRREPPQPAQDVLHPPRRRRPGRRPGRGARPPRAVPAEPPARRPRPGPATGPGPIAAAPWGSAGILPIPWAYIRMMGGDGLRRATEVAILNANYVAQRLGPHYPVLYTGRGGLVAHECIVDLRPITKDDRRDRRRRRQAAHRLRLPRADDVFPVAGTLMIEPTESEDLAELDRFCDAMIAIRAEIDDAARRCCATRPHTAAMLLRDEWEQPYTREEAAYPVAGAAGWRSTGRRSAASTAATATATSCAPAPRCPPTSDPDAFWRADAVAECRASSVAATERGCGRPCRASGLAARTSIATAVPVVDVGREERRARCRARASARSCRW